MPPVRLQRLTFLISTIFWLQAPATPSLTRPFEGITYIDRTDMTPRAVHMHVVQVDLRARGVRFELSPPGGRAEVVRQTVVEFLNSRHAQVAINAHFFWPWPTEDTDVEVLGLAVSNGRVYSSFETPVQSYALLPDAPALNIDRQNRATIVHRSPASADGWRVREHVQLWTTLSGSAQILTNGQITIPQYRDADHPEGMLQPGGTGVTPYSNSRSWYDALASRTAIAISKNGRMLTLFTVDARGGSLGMTPGEVAEVLRRDFGAWQALNLDGGGSTSMAMEDPVTHVGRLLNVPADTPAGRAVGSSLAVFARPSKR
jgi:hypothetical protein